MSKYTITDYDNYFTSINNAKKKAQEISENTQKPIYIYKDGTKIMKYRVGFELENYSDYTVEIVDKEWRTTAFLVDPATHDIAVFDSYDEAQKAGNAFIKNNTERYKINVKS